MLTKNYPFTDHNYHVSESVASAVNVAKESLSEFNNQYWLMLMVYGLVVLALVRFIWSFRDSQPDEIKASVKQPDPPENEDIKIVQRIGDQGARSRAVLVAKTDRYTGSRSNFAVKILSTDAIPQPTIFSQLFSVMWFTRKGVSASINSEQKALQSLNKKSFLVGAQCRRHVGNNVFYVSKLPEGQCVSSMFAKGGPMKKDRVRAVAAQLVLTVDAAHKQEMAVGDIGPESLYLDSSGKLHVILADPLSWKFGSGSSEEEAEFRAADMKDYCSDWYALAQCLVAMISGKYTKNSSPVDVIRKIIKTRNTVIEDLVLKLTSVTSDKNMTKIVKNHQFFSGVDWSNYHPENDDVTSGQPEDDVDEIIGFVQRHA